MQTSVAVTFAGVGTQTATQALLSCAINLPAREPGAVLRFKAGTITIPHPLYRPRSYTVRYFTSPGSDKVAKEETFNFTWEGGGWHFQADEVARRVREGKRESELWGHDKTALAMGIFDEVRRQGGYKFPEGVEKVF